jgi:hypothetical protein
VKAKYANQIFSSYNAPNHLDDWSKDRCQETCSTLSEEGCTC